jgi:hypothetical protein
MPSRLGVALLGMTIGGVTFLISGFAAFLAISQLHDHTQLARAPTVTTTTVQYAQLPPQR